MRKKFERGHLISGIINGNIFSKRVKISLEISSASNKLFQGRDFEALTFEPYIHHEKEMRRCLEVLQNPGTGYGCNKFAPHKENERENSGLNVIQRKRKCAFRS